MKKFISLFLIVGILYAFVPSVPTHVVEASTATSYTMTLNAKGEYVRTQDAYLPDRSLVNLGLKNPQDMIFGDDGILYIADTGNKRIVYFDPSTNTIINSFTYSEFNAPSGVFIAHNSLYIADSGAEKIFRFGFDGQLMEWFGRPTSPSYGDAVFKPSKIAVDNRGNMYVQGFGISDGIIQLTNSGEFIGFFSSNKVRLSLTQLFLQSILSEEQFDSIASRDPLIFSSVFIDSQNIVYTTTIGAYFNGVKKHNTQGSNIFDERTRSLNDARDVFVDSQGIVYAVMERGIIFVYTSEGQLIFTFGANNKNYGNYDISGLFASLASIAVDKEGRIWTLDDSKSFIQTFSQTDYTKQIYSALKLYESRDYEQSIELWNNVLKFNQMSVIAHDSIAKNYLQVEEYESAMIHFRLSGNRLLYSEAFWEVRNGWLKDYIAWIFYAIVAWVVIGLVARLVKKKWDYEKAVQAFVAPVGEIKIVSDLSYVARVMRQPNDSFYEIKRGHHGTWVSATILIVTTFFLFLWYTTSKGFIFQIVQPEDLDYNSLVFGYFSLVGLFLLANYLDTSIHDGEGNFKQIYLMFAYSLGPAMAGLILTTLLSHIFTLNESFFIDTILTVGLGWTLLQLFLGVSEIHQYTFRKTFKSFIVTIAFVIIMLVILIIIVLMWQQLFEFVQAIVKEAIRNVFA